MFSIPPFEEFYNKRIDTFPDNIDNFHNNLKRWFIINVKNAGSNNIILQDQLIEFSLLRLKNGMSSGSNDNIINGLWNNYFRSFLLGATFSPIFPPPGLIIPNVAPSIVTSPSIFQSDINKAETEVQISNMVNKYKKWILSQKSAESWSVPSSTGTIPAPTQYFNLQIIG